MAVLQNWVGLTSDTGTNVLFLVLNGILQIFFLYKLSIYMYVDLMLSLQH